MKKKRSNFRKWAYQWVANTFPALLFMQRSYAQEGEDLILFEFFGAQNMQQGFFVDVGAHHPYRFSNTALFYKKGWRGINIEPTPSLFKAFQQIRKRDINLNLGVARKAGELEFFEFSDPALNGFNAHLSEERNKNTPYKIVKQHAIPVQPLADLLDKNLPKGQEIDFMSVDVEGLDLEVLQSNNWEKYRPKYMLVEDEINLESPQESDIFNFLKLQDYHLLASTSRTLIFRSNR